jgi:hypothetical protein
MFFPFLPRANIPVELDGLPLWAIIGILVAQALQLGVCIWGLWLLWKDWRKGKK